MNGANYMGMRRYGPYFYFEIFSTSGQRIKFLPFGFYDRHSPEKILQAHIMI